MRSRFPDEFVLGPLSFLEQGSTFLGRRIHIAPLERDALAAFIKAKGRPMIAEDIELGHGIEPNRDSVKVYASRINRAFNEAAGGYIISNRHRGRKKSYFLNQELLDNIELGNYDAPPCNDNVAVYGPLAATVNAGWKYNGAPVRLNKMESKVLRAIAEAGGRFVSKEDLIRSSGTSNDASFRVFLTGIRNAFRDHAGDSIIRTQTNVIAPRQRQTSYAINRPLLGLET